MPLTAKIISTSSSHIGLSGLGRALLLALGLVLLIGVVDWPYRTFAVQELNKKLDQDVSPSPIQHMPMSSKFGHEAMGVSETSGIDDNLNVCRRPAAEPSTRVAGATGASGPIPFFGRNDPASMRKMASHLNHLLEEYKEDLVRVVQVSFELVELRLGSARCASPSPF